MCIVVVVGPVVVITCVCCVVVGPVVVMTCVCCVVVGRYGHNMCVLLLLLGLLVWTIVMTTCGCRLMYVCMLQRNGPRNSYIVGI